MARSFFKKTLEQRKADRCDACELRKTLCVCASLPRLTTKTRVSLVMTVSELCLCTNTARQANRALVNSEIRVRGLKDQHFRAEDFIHPDYENWILFPSEGATVLFFGEGLSPVNLIVPDGTWGQAKKIVAREKAWATLKRVTLPPGPPTEYGLRETRHESGVCTYEAIARALGILEGPHQGPEIQAQLEAYFRLRTLRALWARGVVRAEDVPGGIPDAARHEGLKGMRKP